MKGFAPWHRSIEVAEVKGVVGVTILCRKLVVSLRPARKEGANGNRNRTVGGGVGLMVLTVSVLSIVVKRLADCKFCPDTFEGRSKVDKLWYPVTDIVDIIYDDSRRTILARSRNTLTVRFLLGSGNTGESAVLRHEPDLVGATTIAFDSLETFRGFFMF